MSNERPIIFSAPMVRAILEGRKSMTRRIVKFNDSGRVKLNGKQWHIEDPDAINGCPYGTVGDRLWVKETFMGTKDCLSYRATDPRQVIEFGFDRWTPSIYMPRWASRITLEIVSVRVERVREISGPDCIAEGVNKLTRVDDGPPLGGNPWREQKAAFRSLWQSINGPGSWDLNPYVWAISFKVVP